MTIFSKRDDERRSGRADSRKSKRNRLFWMGTSESPRLEPRTMPALTVTTFQIPLVALVEPQGITTGSDGNLWFTENGAGKIGRMTPAGVVTSFALPAVPPPAGSPVGTASTTPHPTAITAGHDGALWFTGIPGEIGRITTAGVVTEFALPAVPPPAGSKPGTASTPAMPTAIAAGPDGALWFTGVPGEVGQISTTGVVTEFAVPEIPPPAGSSPGTPPAMATLTAITAGPDGALWFTGVPGKVGRITTAGVVSEFAVANGTSSAPAMLTAITLGPDGAVWFTGVSGAMGRITTAGVVSEYATPNFAYAYASQAAAITTGPDGNLWLTGNTAIGRITPTGTFTSFAVPGNFDHLAGLTLGPDGNLWFTEFEDGFTRGEQPAVGEITPAGVTKLHALPQGTTLDPNLGVPADPGAITTGPDGALWFGENGAIGRITTAGMIEQFPLSIPTATIGQITPGPGGAVWFVQQNPDESNSIGRITTAGVITEYSLPAGASVGGITEGLDGNLWFTESLNDPNTLANTVAIARITPQGTISSFAVRLPDTHPDFTGGNAVTAITAGPDGNIWFTGDYYSNRSVEQTFIGRITAQGRVRLFALPSSSAAGSSAPLGSYSTDTDSLITGPDGKLWFAADDHGNSGIARISTSGKLAPFIPVEIYGALNSGPDGRVWFFGYDLPSASRQLALATRSGIVVTRDLPQGPDSAGSYLPANFSGLAIGPAGNLWSTNGTSSVVRISGLDGVAGGLDYRHRPKRAPDYVYDQWTNVTTSSQPTFAGVATPGAEVTLSAQKQGESQPVSIGQVKANNSDGSWTLTSHIKLINGNYAVTATQSGDAGQPSVLYSLEPDSSGNLSNALVIQAPSGGKGKA